jgi:protease I
MRFAPSPHDVTPTTTIRPSTAQDGTARAPVPQAIQEAVTMCARVAMIVGPEFEDSEFRIPYDRLRESGHEITVMGPSRGEMVRGKHGRESVHIEAAPRERTPEDFDAVVIPGGYSPDHIRTNRDVVDFVRRFADTGKPVAAVCHGPQLLIEAGVVKGKTMTSWPSVKTDLENAGARWVDQEVVQDGPFITSRKPADLEAFSRALLSALRTATSPGGRHAPPPF